MITYFLAILATVRGNIPEIQGRLVINAIDWIESFPAIHYDIGSVPSKNTGYKRNSLFPGLISDG
jgi:hypothetical protein